ncbi:MBL fold metallo-hydrolase [Candidatus Bathyarchaeota archaeon]|jgi:glyoxylase-like metal-dependent hydrolase (beta-lactamase superfamily II)|nr:MBL fold metallo-hydrolase [Candidatus Bathyarchaeota archaeon]
MSAPEDRKLLIPDRWWDKLPRKIYSSLERVPVSQDWFEVYRVKPDIYVFYEPYQYEEALSTLILGEEKAVLIDTGCGIGNIRKAVEEVTDMPVMVVNTHAHNDHIAQNYLFDEIAMLDHPWSREAQKGLPRSEMVHLIADGMLWKELPVGFDPENYVVPGFKVTQWFKDGDRIELGNRSLEVLHTPGHTPDSVCLLDREDKLLFTGDMFYTGGIYTYLNGGDIPTFIDSYLRMLDYYDEYERLMPSHNEPWVEKILLKDVFKAVVDIAEGRGKYREGTDRGVSIRKYEFGRFSVVTRAP